VVGGAGDRLTDRRFGAHHGAVRFRDRADAGRRLAASLANLRSTPGLIVLGLPRGGVVVAAEVAKALEAPLDVLVVRKLGFPGHEELAMGAVASGGVRVLNEDVLAHAALDPEVVARREEIGHGAVRALEHELRGDRAAPDLDGRVVVLVDDGLATGATMRVAVAAARAAGAARVIAAVPVGSPEAVRDLRPLTDDVVCLSVPMPFRAVGLHYGDFAAVSDREVHRLLE
jgi:predicted phosphoribosyltransferase